MPTLPHRYGIIGAGRAAGILAKGLRSARADVRVWARRSECGARFTEMGIPVVRDESALLQATDVLLLAVSDGAIGRVADRLADLWPEENQPTIALHLAGALSCHHLSVLRERGCSVGVFHPVAALQDAVPEMVEVSLSGDPAARAAGVALAQLFGWRTFEIDDERRPAFHCALSLAANDIVPLLKHAETLAVNSGLDAGAARTIVTDLARGIIDAYAQYGDGCLTGPASRGDADTLMEHFRAVGDDEEREGLLATHRLLSIACARIAHARGRLDEKLLDLIIRTCR